MTADPMVAERDRLRAEQFADALRRIADAITAGELPAPSIAVELSWYLHGDLDEQRARAVELARVLGGPWQAHPYATSTGYASSRATLVPGMLTAAVALDLGEPEHPPTPPGAELAAALNAATEGDRQARIAAQGPPITPEAFEAATGIPAASLLVVDESGAPLRDDDYTAEGIDRDTEGDEPAEHVCDGGCRR